jgi:hypothetical protein
MGHLSTVFCVLSLAACQPMYGQRAEPLSKYEPGKHPVVPPEQIAYVDDCNFDFHKHAPVAHVKTNVQLDQQGEVQVAKAEKTPPAQERVDLVTDAISTYSRALRDNPYDPDATLGLARAYDSVRRKGCALALLDRLGTLSEHPKFASSALPVAQSVVAHRAWFHDYRKEALAALRNP